VDRKRTESYPKASRVLVMTQEAKNYFSEEIQKKCVVIPNPLRDDLPEPYTGERRKVVVNFCRLTRQKNLPLLIDAFALFHQTHPDYRLELYGQGELQEELEQKIEALHLQYSVSILPFDSNVHQKIRDCAMFVSSSDWEGWSNSVMEALALGLPTISTDCDFGPRDMIKDHENGILTPVGNVEALAGAMAEIADDPVFSAELSKKAAGVRTMYAAHVIGKKWLDLVEEVSKERGPS
jgi:glycosyltransferase involved in cell wall biosynthesis